MSQLILDPSSSFKAMWRGCKDYPGAVFSDQRPEVKPMVVCVWSFLPFRDEVFVGVTWDPPHMLYLSKGKPMMFNFVEKYGILKYGQWEAEFLSAFYEFMRVLQPEGSLLLKWNNNHVRDERMLACLPRVPDHRSVVRHSRGVRKQGSQEPRSITTWFYFNKSKSCGRVAHSVSWEAVS